MISFIAVCSFALIQGNIIKDAVDDGIYGAIHQLLKNSYPDEPEKTQCMIDNFRRNKIADRFYTPDLLFNNEKLQREIQPYVDEANFRKLIVVKYLTIR